MWHTSSTVLATSLVSEVAMVWILMGWSLPSGTFPTITVRVFLLLVWWIDSQYFCLGTNEVKNRRKGGNRLNLGQILCDLKIHKYKHATTQNTQIIPKSGLPSDDGSSSMVSEPVLEFFTTNALLLEELILIVLTPGTDKTLAKSTLLVNPMPPSRTRTCGRGAGATPVAMTVCK